MKYQYSVVSCKKAVGAPRTYGYTLRVEPKSPYLTGNFQGWYKYKACAVNRAKELNSCP